MPTELKGEALKKYKQLLTCRSWLEVRRFDEAYYYAKKRGFTLDDAYASLQRGTLPSIPKGWMPPDQRSATPAANPVVDLGELLAKVKKSPSSKSALTIPEPERPTAPVIEVKVQEITVSGDITSATTLINGWPAEAEAVIFNTCRNQNLLVIQLPDGRTASILRDGRRSWRIGATVKVKLESAQADPLYKYAAP